MAKLIGAQRMVLQAILDLPKDAAGYVTDSQISQMIQITITDIRDWVETLESDGLVNVARITGGLNASITASGKLALRQFQPFGSTSTAPQTSPVIVSSGNSPAAESTSPSPGSSTAGQIGSPDSGASVSVAPNLKSLIGEPKAPIEVFFSYSHKDKELRDELEEHLSLLRRQGVISGWHDRQILPGREWAGEISEHLESARVVLLLVSSSFLASDYCYDIEMKRALERHESQQAVVIPLIVRPCDWKSGPFAKLAALPTNWVAVTSWPNKDEAWTDVAKGIRRAVKAMMAKPQ